MCAMNHKWLTDEKVHWTSACWVAEKLLRNFVFNFMADKMLCVCLIHKPMTYYLWESSVMSQLEISNHPHRSTPWKWMLNLDFHRNTPPRCWLTNNRYWKISLSKLLHFIPLTLNRLFENNKCILTSDKEILLKWWVKSASYKLFCGGTYELFQ